MPHIRPNSEVRKDEERFDFIVIGYGKSSCNVAAATAVPAKSVHVVTREVIWKSP